MNEASSTPVLEVVICTYDNSKTLGEVLTALARQQFLEPLHWGCLVVDNNCTDDTPQVVHQHATARLIPDLRVVREPEQD